MIEGKYVYQHFVSEELHNGLVEVEGVRVGISSRRVRKEDAILVPHINRIFLARDREL